MQTHKYVCMYVVDSVCKYNKRAAIDCTLYFFLHVYILRTFVSGSWNDHPNEDPNINKNVIYY